jgi:hypothetical protein
MDQLIDATVPAAIRLGRSRSRIPPALAEEHAPAARAPRHRRAQTRRCSSSLIGMGYYDTITPRDPAQHPRKPRLVHPVHPLPGGDFPGPPRGAAELPDDGRRPDRPADRQRLAAGRGDGRGRGHGDVPPRTRGKRTEEPSGLPTTATPRRSPSSTTRAATRWASRSVTSPEIRIRNSTRRDDLPACSCSTPTPTAHVGDYHRPVLEAGPPPALRRRGRPARAHAPEAARRVGMPTSPWARRSGSACRSATAAPTPPSIATHRTARPQAARPPGRRLQGRNRPARLPPGDADPRAAHSPRQGHEQHLHRPGSPGDHGQHVRRLPRPDGLRRIATRVHAADPGVAQTACGPAG